VTKLITTMIAAVALGGVLCACATGGNHTAGATDPAANAQEDLRITYDVMQSIAKHPDLGPPNEIYVNTRDHVVYLTGTVDSSSTKDNAKAVARQVTGVTDVVSTIGVSK
jgi:osmotically-inducible protein OsmY